EIAALKQQLLLLSKKLDALQKQTAENAKAAARAAAKADAKAQAKLEALEAKGLDAKLEGKVDPTFGYAEPPPKTSVATSGVVVTMPGNRPTICTSDNRNCISLTGRLHFDAGGYDYNPHTPATNPQILDGGLNARRARLGVIGKFLGDWNYALVYDFGGSSDGFGGTGSFGATTTTGGTAIGLLPGGGTSGIEIASLGYSGFKPFGGQLVIEGGYLDTLF